MANRIIVPAGPGTSDYELVKQELHKNHITIYSEEGPSIFVPDLPKDLRAHLASLPAVALIDDWE